MSTVDALSSNVNATIEAPSDAVMHDRSPGRQRRAPPGAHRNATECVRHGRLHPRPPATEPPTITGSSGSTQGASVVSTPATRAPSRASIAAQPTFAWISARSSESYPPVHFVSCPPPESMCT